MPKRRLVDESGAATTPEVNSSSVKEQVRLSKRTKKPLEILSLDATPQKKELTEGHGTKLKDIPAVCKSIKTYPASSYHYFLESLHHVLYGFAGTNSNRRQHILNFSGFPLDDEVSRQRKRKQLLSNAKYTHDRCFMIKKFLEILCIDCAGVNKKEELIELLLDFLFDPK